MSVGSAANADILTFSISGVFDAAPTLTSGPNAFAPYVGETYSMSASVSTNNIFLIRTQVDLSTLPPNQEAWFFSTNSTFHSPAGGYDTALGGVVADVTNNFYYDGLGGAPVDTPAGYYDDLALVGYLRGSGPVIDPAHCHGGGSLLDSPDGAPSPCALEGLNYEVNINLAGTSGFIPGIGANPFGSLDFSQIIYGSAEFSLFNDGVLIGKIAQDPPLTYHDGILSGPNMTLSFSLVPVPEPATWAMMLAGFGGLGVVLRRRRARPELAGA
jgi:hypothetical protein